MTQPHEHLLIVEDSPDSIKLIRHALESLYSLNFALDGATALDSAVRQLPDLILLDVDLPGLNGFDICRRFKQQPLTRDIPVIFLTALTGQSDEALGLAAGGSDFIGKPFNPDLLKARIRIHLELKMHRDRLDRLVAERTAELVKTREAVVASLAILAEFRDQETGMHTQRTRAYVRCLAEAARRQGVAITDSAVEWISQTAQLHDIGKVGIPDAILLKPGSLTDEEFEVIKRHTLIGGEAIRRAESIIGQNTFLHFAREIAEYHHEHWDGSGYPHGLRGSAIPISAQLMSLVDVYDALANERPYKPALPHARVVSIILNGDGRTRPEHFSPIVLQAFRSCHDEFEAINHLYREAVQAGGIAAGGTGSESAPRLPAARENTAAAVIASPAPAAGAPEWQPREAGRAFLVAEASSQYRKTGWVTEALADIPGFDPAAGLLYMQDDCDFYVQMLKQFAASHAQDAIRLHSALEAGDSAAAIRIAHSLKGLAGTLGAGALQAQAKALELELRAGMTLPAVEPDVLNLEALLAGLVSSLSGRLQPV